MESQRYTFVDATSATEIDATVAAGVARVSAKTFEEVTGWSLKPEGFCRDDVCIPAGEALADDGSVDLAVYAALSNRPLVLDEAQQALSLGESAADRSQNLESLEAPDFSLPDLDGKTHRLSDYRGKKVLLAAYASW